ncbi:MAG: hypothetical protein ACFFD4_18785 [Candidatus Odinarchaeota archaeon]
MEIHVNHALEKQFNDLPARLRRSFRKHGVIIVDFHCDPYYGKRDTLGAVHLPPGRGTLRSYNYLTADLWSPGGIFTIAVRVTFQPVHGKFKALIVSPDLSITPADARVLYSR